MANLGRVWADPRLAEQPFDNFWASFSNFGASAAVPNARRPAGSTPHIHPREKAKPARYPAASAAQNLGCPQQSPGPVGELRSTAGASRSLVQPCGVLQRLALVWADRSQHDLTVRRDFDEIKAQFDENPYECMPSIRRAARGRAGSCRFALRLFRRYRRRRLRARPVAERRWGIGGCLSAACGFRRCAPLQKMKHGLARSVCPVVKQNVEPRRASRRLTELRRPVPQGLVECFVECFLEPCEASSRSFAERGATRSLEEPRGA